MSEIIDETINELNKPTQNNVFSIEDDPVTVLEKINQVERYLKQIDTRVDTSINTANEALEKANNAFEANGTLVKINGENQLTWSADFAESERQKSKNLFKLNFWNKSSNIYEVNGITFTYNPDDYSITINGTASARALCYLNPDALSNIKIGTYTFSGFNKKTNYSVYIQAFNEADGKYPALLYSDSDFRTVTFNIMPNFTDLYISVDAGIVVDNLVIKLQAEEGSVATDYQPYNGAIIHEKEIADVEHIDLIYEMNTKNTIGGTAYTAGIPFSRIAISNVDFNKYKDLRFTCRWNYHGSNWFGGTITFNLDLTTPYNSDAEYMAVISSRPSSCYVADDTLTFDLVGQIVVNGNKNSLSVNGYKITYTGERTAYTSDNYLTYFRIEKIEGIR